MKFGEQVRRWSKKTEDKMAEAVKKIALDTFSAVIFTTPVDEGRARGSWNTAIGAPVGGDNENLDPSGAGVLAQAQGVIDGSELGDVIYMVSTLEYMQYLDAGSSKKAPSGMTELARQRFQPVANSVFADLATQG